MVTVFQLVHWGFLELIEGCQRVLALQPSLTEALLFIALLPSQARQGKLWMWYGESMRIRCAILYKTNQRILPWNFFPCASLSLRPFIRVQILPFTVSIELLNGEAFKGGSPLQDLWRHPWSAQRSSLAATTSDSRRNCSVTSGWLKLAKPPFLDWLDQIHI